MARPDIVVYHAVKSCECGEDLSLINPDKIETSQVFDLPVTKIVITEHQIEVRKITAELAAGLKGALTEYGPQIKALATHTQSSEFRTFGGALWCQDIHFAKPCPSLILGIIFSMPSTNER